ncbi:MAG TPA: hypothetical protein VG096_23270 [Bryobacteraceae bacterium]|jgi:hypothetical protein|nr:hypothetical protein [Bryobacteraceae bacterium]
MRSIAVFLAALLAAPGAFSQQMLNLVVVEGEGAINNIRQRTARDPIVRVEDENHKPVAGAAVVFLLPSQGASGTFTGGVQTLTVMTNAQGLAVGRGLKPNNVQGQYQISVNASFQGQTASIAIAQSNALAAAGTAAAAAGISGKLIAVLLIAGGAAAAGAVAATRGGSSSNNTSPPASPTTITAGAGTVGAPH